MDTSNQTLFHSAVESNDFEKAELLLREGVNVYSKNQKGLTPLHIIIQKRIELFESLHAKENEKFSDHALSAEGYKYLEEPGADKDEHLMSLYKTDKKRQQYFRKDKEESLNAICKKIDKNGKFINMLLKHKSSNCDSIEDLKLLKFYAACTLKNTLVAESLAQQIYNIDQSVNRNSPIYGGYSALHFAALCNINMVKMLVTKGANLLTQDTKGVTPLEICIKLYSVEEIQSIMILVSAWTNIFFSDGKTKLMDYISTLHDSDDHKKFLQNMDMSVGVSLFNDSPLWPGYTVLHVAIFLLPESNLEMFKDIVNVSTDIVIAQDSRGSSPVHLAFRKNKLKVVEILLNILKSYKNLGNITDEDRLSHLHIAASVNQQTIAKHILKNETHFDVVYKGKPLPSVKPGWTPLHTAAFTTHAIVARLLLQKGANLLAIDSGGFTAIHLLLSTNYTDKVAQVLFASDQLKECVVEGVGLTHLHIATWKNKSQTIEQLLELGSDIEATIIGQFEDKQLKKFEGCRPIHIAMMGYCLFETYEVLVKRGADILAKKLDGSSPLSEVLTGKYDLRYIMPIVDSVCNNKDLRNRLERELGITLLHLACYIFDEKMIHELLIKRVDVNTRTRDDSSIWPGFTPLHVLIFAGLNLEHDSDAQNAVDVLCVLLLKNGADVTMTNAEGDTPVLMALKSRYTNKRNIRASFLMSYQRDFSVNPVNKAGMSHFHAACLLYEVETANKFLKMINHIDVNQAVNSSDNSRFAGHTPLLLALTARAKKSYDPEAQIKMVDLLLERDADVHAVDAFGYTPLHKLCSCTPTRVDLLNKILIDNTDINKRTVDGKTPMEILLWDGASRGEIDYFLERGAKINAYNPVSDVGYIAIVLDSDKYKKSSIANKILKMMINLPDISEISDTGRNAIHNIVSAECSRVGVIEYGKLLKKLVSFGCDLFKQDDRGRTALHLAVKFQNRSAIKELLNYGADVNIVDSTGMSPFSYASKFRKDSRYSANHDSNASICKILAIHLRKLQLVGWYLSELNAKLLNEVLNKREDIDFEDTENKFIRQLEIAKTIEICKRGFTIRDFLYQTGVVNLYSSLSQTNRDAVDSFFKSSYAFELSELTILLKLQYKCAVARVPLLRQAVNRLRELLGFPLPVLCVEIILMYLTNSDLKNMIEATSILDDASAILD